MFRDAPEPRPASVEIRIRLDRPVFDALTEQVRRRKLASPASLARRLVERGLERMHRRDAEPGPAG